MSSENLQLPARVTVEHAQEALTLATSKDPEVALAVDASEVETIDGAAILTFATIAHNFADSERGPGPKLAVVNPTPAFVDAFADLGLFQDMMKMEFRK